MPARPFESLRSPAVRSGWNLPNRAKPNGATGDEWTTRDSRPPRNPRQDVLLLHAAGEAYALERGYDVPEPKGDAELLVQVLAVGLNPVDWKGADFGFGQPSYPWINGRDFAGVVVRAPRKSGSRVQQGQVVFGTSTDYRDTRKATFQQYLVANDFNVSWVDLSNDAGTSLSVNSLLICFRRIPYACGLTIDGAAALGTAFIAATIGLGVCFGLDFSTLISNNAPRGPNLLRQARENSAKLPKDTYDEVMKGIPTHELPQPGEWIVVWGAGVAGQFMIQLAKLVGLKVACVDELTQIGGVLSKVGVDFMVDFKAHKPDRIVEILRAVTGGKLRFGLDTVGKKTAESLQKSVQPSQGRKAHVAGLSGLPDSADEGVTQHKALPIKLFHELPDFGESISRWLEQLLVSRSIILPDIEVATGGLSGINEGLDRMRRGEILAKRIVVPLS